MANFDVTGKLTNSGGGALVPIGCILPYAGISIPDNWLYCAGLEVSRTEYAELFAVLGDRFGAGNGSTTFNIPDLREKFIFGANPGNPSIASYTLGVTGGSKDAVVVSHNHTFTGNQITGQVGGTDIESHLWRGSRVQSGCLSYSDNNYTKYDGHTNGAAGYSAKTINFSATPSGSISTEGSSASGANMPPYACFYYIIRAK